MKKVMVFGTFDILHEGHLFVFSEAKKYGDYLVVVVARDKTVLAVKGRETTHTEDKRLAAVQAVPTVDLAVLGRLDDVYEVISENRPDVVCLGYDQQAFTDKLAEELNKRKIDARIVRLPPFREDVYKSSLLKTRRAA